MIAPAPGGGRAADGATRPTAMAQSGRQGTPCGIVARMSDTGGAADQAPSDRPRRGVLVYGMYSLAGPQNKAPKVRIAMIAAALGRNAHTELISGGRLGRVGAAMAWTLKGGPRRVGAVYVEAPTSNAMPTDMAFLLLMRLLRKPVGVYFRDAYQLFRDVYPRARRTQLLTDWLWRLTMPAMKAIASHHYVQSEGLGRVLKLRDAVILPPGTDPGAPDLGAGAEQLVAYVGNYGRADGFDDLVAAMAIVRRSVPAARLRVVGPPLNPDRLALLPEYVEICQGSREELPDLLADARVCVIPRPLSAYTSLLLPVKLWDYLSLGKPVVATSPNESDRILQAAGAGILTPEGPEGLAGGLALALTDRRLADKLAAGARAFACSGEQDWDARARTILDTLGVAPVRRRGSR
jgi:glycosyltransferase involved in cell wall biosynthesis